MQDTHLKVQPLKLTQCSLHTDMVIHSLSNVIPEHEKEPEVCDEFITKAIKTETFVFPIKCFIRGAEFHLATQTKLTTVDHGQPRTTMVDHELHLGSFTIWPKLYYLSISQQWTGTCLQRQSADEWITWTNKSISAINHVSYSKFGSFDVSVGWYHTAALVSWWYLIYIRELGPFCLFCRQDKMCQTACHNTARRPSLLAHRAQL